MHVARSADGAAACCSGAAAPFTAGLRRRRRSVRRSWTTRRRRSPWCRRPRPSSREALHLWLQSRTCPEYRPVPAVDQSPEIWFTRLLDPPGGYRETLCVIAAASGASVAPRFGPAIDTRYCDPRRESGTVIAKVPFPAVRFAPQRTHPGAPHPEQSKNPARRIGVPAFVGDVPVTARPWKVARP